MFIKLCAVEDISIPFQSRWAVHDVALSPLAALDKLGWIMGREVELAQICIFLITRVVVSTIIARA